MILMSIIYFQHPVFLLFGQLITTIWSIEGKSKK